MNAAVNYELPLPESIGQVQAGAIYAYTSSQIASAASRFGTLPSFDLVNFTLEWNNIVGNPIDIQLFLTNAFDEDYQVYRTGLFESIGVDAARYGDPRSYGVKVRYRFGS